jgi:hypothetical protein
LNGDLLNQKQMLVTGATKIVESGDALTKDAKELVAGYLAQLEKHVNQLKAVKLFNTYNA